LINSLIYCEFIAAKLLFFFVEKIDILSGSNHAQGVNKRKKIQTLSRQSTGHTTIKLSKTKDNIKKKIH
jgi:hypothetical protein